MIRKLNTYTFLIITTILSFFVMASFKTPTEDLRESGWFGYIDDTAFIFIVLALPFFAVILAYTFAGNAFKKITSSDTLSNLSSSQKALLYITHPLFIFIVVHTKIKNVLQNLYKSKIIKYGLLLLISIVAIYFFSHTALLGFQKI